MLVDMTLAHCVEVVANMREEDAHCVRAVMGMEPGEWFAVDRWQASGPAWTVLQDGRPQAIGGLALPNAWTGVMWLVAKPDTNGSSWRKLLRAGRTVIASAMDPDSPVHRRRVEAYVLGCWSGAQNFARHLGMRHEHTRFGAGAGGEDLQGWVATSRSAQHANRNSWARGRMDHRP